MTGRRSTRNRRAPSSGIVSSRAVARTPLAAVPAREAGSSDAMAGAVARTMADAQAVGRAAARLAYDVGAMIGLAARGLVSATLDAADTVAPRPVPKTAAARSTLPAFRKPPAAVASKPASSRVRRVAG